MTHTTTNNVLSKNLNYVKFEVRHRKIIKEIPASFCTLSPLQKLFRYSAFISAVAYVVKLDIRNVEEAISKLGEHIKRCDRPAAKS